MNALSSPIQESPMKLELKYQDTCGEQAGKHQAVAYCWHSPA
jgi:hypothetical protein